MAEETLAMEYQSGKILHSSSEEKQTPQKGVKVAEATSFFGCLFCCC